jgi:N-acetylmuramoyl-L-alanine amidase
MKKYITVVLLSFLFIISVCNVANAQTLHTYTVKSSDTLWKIAANNGVTVASLKKVNNKSNDSLYVGQVLKLPYRVTEADKVLMAKLVRAEAQGEPYAGKVAVATVILNRVDSPSFPNNVRDVIYQVTEGKYYAFSPVQNGEINKPYDADSMRAVNEALKYRGQGSGSIYFYNPKTSKSTWILSRPVTVVIGNHKFAR